MKSSHSPTPPRKTGPKVPIPTGWRVMEPTEYLEYSDRYFDLRLHVPAFPVTGFRVEENGPPKDRIYIRRIRRQPRQRRK